MYNGAEVIVVAECLFMLNAVQVKRDCSKDLMLTMYLRVWGTRSYLIASQRIDSVSPPNSSPAHHVPSNGLEGLGE